MTVGLTPTEVRVDGRQRGEKENHRGVEYEEKLIPKTRIGSLLKASK